MSNLFAGGLRIPRTFVAAPGEDARASGLGADLAHGLECAKWEHTGTDTRCASKAILRSEPCSVRKVERVCGKAYATARTTVLRSEGILLGSSDCLCTSSPLGRRARFNVLGWSGCENHSGTRENAEHAPVIADKPDIQPLPNIFMLFAKTSGDELRGSYVAGTEWCSCITRHRPSILRRPIVNRKSTCSGLPFVLIPAHRPAAVAKATSFPAVTPTS